MPACSPASGDIFRTHGSAITHREENGLEDGQGERGGPALSRECLREGSLRTTHLRGAP